MTNDWVGDVGDKGGKLKADDDSHRAVFGIRTPGSRTSPKAAKQLAGACANISRGLAITDADGKEISVERDQPIHCIRARTLFL